MFLTSAQRNFHPIMGINLPLDDGHAVGRNDETNIYLTHIEKFFVISHEFVAILRLGGLVRNSLSFWKLS